MSKEDINLIKFLRKHSSQVSALSWLALYVLRVPATSAPVERVFNRREMMMRSHYASVTHSTPTELIFLRCKVLL